MIAALLRAGFTHERTVGGHAVLTKPGIARPVIVPLWNELPEFIVSNNLRTAGISRKEYLVLMGKRKPR
ncbi:MAG: type II toxin-antitoxin system HicA family toxin [Myxococcota bacterium]|nr:type II toxin-antitoxin system HicA family toxin [Myxococcota bacterium]